MCDRSLNVIVALLALLALLIILLLCVVVYKCRVDCQNERQHDNEISEMKLLLRRQLQAILEPESVNRKKIEELCREKFEDQLEKQQKANGELQSKLASLEKANKQLAEVVSSLKKNGVIISRKNSELTECASKLRKRCAELIVVCRKLEFDNKTLLRSGNLVSMNLEFCSFEDVVNGVLQMSSNIELFLLKKSQELDALAVGEVEYHMLALRTILMDFEKQEKVSNKTQPTQQVKAALVFPCDDKDNNKAA